MTPQRNAGTDAMWALGDLRFLLREGGQAEMHKFIVDTMARDHYCANPIVGNAHRQMGKSFDGLLMCCERGMQSPRQNIKYGAPSDDMARDIVLPNMRTLLITCPMELRPHQAGYHFTFWNPRWGVGKETTSTLHIVGLNYMEGDRLRGPCCDFAFLDEVALVPNLRYLVESVLSSQFAKRANPGLVMVSTPPKSMDHEFVQYFIQRAKSEGRYFDIPIDKNPNFNEQDKTMLLRALGGSEDSIAWKREALCQLVSDEEDLITPEFVKAKESILVEDYPRPKFYVPYVVIDGAYKRDMLAVLFVYVDFINQTMVVIDSIVQREMTTRELASRLRALEHDIFFTSNATVRRRGDLTPQQIGDLCRDYRIPMMRLENKDPDSAVAKLRAAIGSKKLRIHTKRKTLKGETIEVNQALIHQLENGIYNKRRTDYERTQSMGHWDAGQALAYAVRVVNWKENPWIGPMPEGFKGFRGMSRSERPSRRMSYGLHRIAQELGALKEQ